VILNPGAWSHYSYAIRDAVELFTIPVVEVHLSNIKEREAWRQQSVVADLATQTIYGKGPDGYREALVFLAENVKVKTATPAAAEAEAAEPEAAPPEEAQAERPQAEETQ
jgi:3-dehydroquinate dehydratase-2